MADHTAASLSNVGILKLDKNNFKICDVTCTLPIRAVEETSAFLENLKSRRSILKVTQVPDIFLL